jgi:hypothetical protein
MEPGTQLLSMLKRISELDQSIRLHARLDERVLSRENFETLLADLSLKRPVAGGDAGTSDPDSLLLGIHQALQAKTAQGANPTLLSILQAGLLQSTEHIFNYLRYETDTDTKAFALIGHLQLPVTRLLARDDTFLSDPNHAMRRLCEMLLRICRLFDAYSGSRAERLMRDLGTAVGGLAICAPEDQDSLQKIIDRVVEVFDLHNQESAELARKLIVGEQGACLQQNAKQVVNREIFQAVEGLRLPQVFVRFLERVWSKYLYVTYLRRGTDSREWGSGVKIIRLLADSLHIRGRDTMFRYYGKHIPAALRSLSDGAASVHQEATLTGRLLAELNAVHQAILNEQPVDTSQWLAVRSANPDNLARTAQKPTKRIDALLPGHWYKLEIDDHERRCKLIERNLEHGYCLFSNLSGIRIARLEFSDTDRLVSEGKLRRMEDLSAFNPALKFCVAQLQKQMPGLERQALEAEQVWDEAERQAKQQAAEERLRQREEQRRRDEEVRQQEKLRAEENTRRDQAEAEARKRQEVRNQQIELALKKVEQMQSGGWLEYIGADDQRISCKLGLRLKSSGKMIFVDNLGRKVIELRSVELAERIVDGNAAILDFGVAFDSTLSGLINERSERIHHDEPD